jgi:cbb3-type cytochrome oxidase maturation protein
MVTPWLAALAMSGSSVLVMMNALRLQCGGIQGVLFFKKEQSLITSLAQLILRSVSLGLGALILFLGSLRSGQYEDPDGTASRILFDG